VKKPSPGSGSRLKERREAVAENPDSARAHLRLGTALMKVGMVGKAEESLRRAVEIDPEYAEAWSNLGGALLSRWDFAGCLDANRRALERKPDLTQAHYNIGLCHLYKGDAKDVVKSFRKVVELEPGNAGGHYYLAVGLHADGETEAARASLGRALALGHSPEPEFLKAMEKQGVTGGPEHTFEFGPDSEKSTK
jgi:tetratricopeptide (TPR) repeat protein